MLSMYEALPGFSFKRHGRQPSQHPTLRKSYVFARFSVAMLKHHNQLAWEKEGLFVCLAFIYFLIHFIFQQRFSLPSPSSPSNRWGLPCTWIWVGSSPSLKRVYFILKLVVHHPGQEVGGSRDYGGLLLACLLFMACSVCFLIAPRPPVQEWYHHSELGPLTSTINQKQYTTGLFTAQSYEGTFWVKVPSSKVTWACNAAAWVRNPFAFCPFLRVLHHCLFPLFLRKILHFFWFLFVL